LDCSLSLVFVFWRMTPRLRHAPNTATSFVANGQTRGMNLILLLLLLEGFAPCGLARTQLHPSGDKIQREITGKYVPDGAASPFGGRHTF